MGGDVQGQSFIQDEIKLEEEEGFVKFECAAFVETPVETILKSDVDVRDEEQSMMGRDVFPDVDAELKPTLKQEGEADEFITGDLDQSDDDDDEKEDDVNSPPPKRSRLAVNQKKKGDSYFERKISYNCESCPFTTKNSTHFENHLALHKKSSNSIICSECGWYVKPSTMVTHQITRHAATMRPTVNGTEMMTMDNSNPNFVSYYCAISSKRIHKCRKCPYQNVLPKAVERHAAVHKKGSNAVTCNKCGIYISPLTLSKHRISCLRKRVSDSRTPVAVPVVVNCKISR